MEYVTTHEHENVYSSGDGERADALSKPAGDGERADALSKLAGDGNAEEAGRPVAEPPRQHPLLLRHRPAWRTKVEGPHRRTQYRVTAALAHRLPRPHELQIERLCS
jgi:hypothetical protein